MKCPSRASCSTSSHQELKRSRRINARMQEPLSSTFHYVGAVSTQTLLTKLDLAKFPFTSEASSYIRSRNIDPIELTRPELVPILERAMERIRQGVFGGKISADLTQEDVDILAYPTALMLISSVGDDRTRRRYALAEAKRAYELLRYETPEKLLQIATGSFSWDAKLVEMDVGGTHFEFALHFRFYVRNSARIHDLRWKLVNRVLTEGYVLLPAKTSLGFSKRRFRDGFWRRQPIKPWLCLTNLHDESNRSVPCSGPGLSIWLRMKCPMRLWLRRCRLA